jgi:DNA-binding transcriptional MerR regulator/quercetin dioxygenase-like cupin family protein
VRRKTGPGFPSASPSNTVGEHHKIGDVARLIGVSASLIRSWERLGIIKPARTDGRYRVYSKDQIKVLRRARFLRRVRGLNGPAIVETLKAEGLLKTTGNNRSRSIGARFRHLRVSRGLSLAEVANSVGISTGFLSAFERSQMSASIGTLRRLARYYKLNILDFFDAATATNPRLVRPGDRKQLDAGPGIRMDLLAWGNPVMEPHLFTIAPGAGSGEPYAHEGEEFIFVLHGKLNIALDGEEFELRSGDSFYFESSTSHTWRNAGKSQTVVLWINTPPTF